MSEINPEDELFLDYYLHGYLKALHPSPESHEFAIDESTHEGRIATKAISEAFADVSGKLGEERVPTFCEPFKVSQEGLEKVHSQAVARGGVPAWEEAERSIEDILGW